MIDPDVLARQTVNLRRVGRLSTVGECKGCGKDTAAKDGWCSACQNGRTPALWSTPKLLAMRAEIETELKRRRAEIDDALKGGA